jgi:hypothetical protein
LGFRIVCGKSFWIQRNVTFMRLEFSRKVIWKARAV